MVYLAELFPNAKFIFMLRDGRASAHSGWFRILQCVCNRKRGCVVRMVVDSILPHAEFGPNDHRKDAPLFMNASPNNQQCENHF